MNQSQLINASITRSLALFLLEINELEKQEDHLETIEDLKALKQLRVKYNLILQKHLSSGKIPKDPLAYVSDEIEKLIRWIADFDNCLEKNVFSYGQELIIINKSIDQKITINNSNRISLNRVKDILANLDEQRQKFDNQIILLQKDHQADCWINDSIDSKLVTIFSKIKPGKILDETKCKDYHLYLKKTGEIYKKVNNHFNSVQSFGDELIEIYEEQSNELKEINKIDREGNFNSALSRHKNIKHIFNDINYSDSIDNSSKLNELISSYKTSISETESKVKTLDFDISNLKLLSKKREIKNRLTRDISIRDKIEKIINELDDHISKWSSDSESSIELSELKNTAQKIFDSRNKTTIPKIRRKLKCAHIIIFVKYLLIITSILIGLYYYQLNKTILTLNISTENFDSKYQKLISNKVIPNIMLNDMPLSLENWSSGSIQSWKIRPSGKWKLTVKAAGFYEHIQNIDVSLGKKNIINPIILRRKVGNLTIRTDPSKVNVKINGINMGKTPLSLDKLPVGNYGLNAEHPYHGEFHKLTTLSDKENLEINHRYPRGSLKINSVPSESTVLINGKIEGKTPLLLENINPTSHNITLKKQIHGIDYESKIQAHIKDSNTTEINHEYKIGSLRIETTPSKSSIFLNEKLLGKSPLSLDRFPAGTNYITITNLIDGIYPYSTNILISLANKQKKTQNIEIPRGQLTITSSPSGRNVRYKDRILGRTPLKLTNIPAGPHTFELESTKSFEWPKIKINSMVAANKTTTISNRAINGKITCNLKPSGTKIALKTPIQTSLSEERQQRFGLIHPSLLSPQYIGKSPMTLTNYPAGEHIFLFSKSGYKPQDVTVNIKDKDNKIFTNALESYENGEIEWKVKHKIGTFSSNSKGSAPSLDINNNVYFSTENYRYKYYRSYDSSGIKRFEIELEDNPSHYSPVIGAQSNFIITDDRLSKHSIIRAYDNDSGKLKWTKKVLEGKISQIASYNNKNYFSTILGNLVVQKTDTGKLINVKRLSASQRRNLDYKNFFGGGPTIKNNSIIINDLGTVFCLDLKTLDLKWKKTLEKNTYHNFDPAFLDNNEFTYTFGNYIYIFNEDRFLKRYKWRKSGFFGFGMRDNYFNSIASKNNNIILESLFNYELSIFNTSTKKITSIISQDRDNRYRNHSNSIERHTKLSTITTKDRTVFYFDWTGQYEYDYKTILRSTSGLRKNLGENAFGSVLSPTGSLFIVGQKHLYKIATKNGGYQPNNWSMHRGNPQRTAVSVISSGSDKNHQ